MIVVLAKDRIRKALQWMGLHVTTNLKYDFHTRNIIKAVLSDGGGICIDVGCHKGEVFDDFIKYAPKHIHHGFEPIPYLFKNLVQRYQPPHHIYPFALGATNEETTFQHIKNAPAYSGLKPRKYDIADPDIEIIQVPIRKLDDIISKEESIKLIKIDVEGAELGVLLGGAETIKRSRPTILFEFGLGASDMYGTQPEDIFTFFDRLNYKLYPLLQYHKGLQPLDLPNLKKWYLEQGEFFYVAKP
jgi:FkbM family methyltransferase